MFSGAITEFAPELVGDHAVEPGAFVDLVEVRQRLAREKFLAGVFVVDRRPLDVVEQAFDEIGRGREVLEPLLILDADGRAPNSAAMRTAAMYILHCCRTCASVSSVSSFVPEVKRHALVEQPVVDRARFRRPSP